MSESDERNAAIFEQLRAEHEALRVSEERFRTLVEMSSDAVLLVDGEGSILYATSSVNRLLGYLPCELLGRSGFELVHADDQSPAQQILQGAVDRPGDHVPFLIRVLHKDGSTRFVDGFCTNHFHNPAVQAVVVNFRDVTERKQAEEQQRKLEAQIVHAQKLESLGVLAGGIAHEFNNLLQSVAGNASLALMQLPGDSPVAPVLQAIEKAGRRAADLTQQMSAYSGRSRFMVKPIRLDAMVQEIVTLLRGVVSRSADLQLTLEPATIDGDATQIRQVITNLMTNASEALDGHEGMIRVRTGTRPAGDAAHLHSAFAPEEIPAGVCAFVEVEDNGCGMSEDTLLRIFDPFFSTKFKGRGLGLAAVLGIVRGHGGVIKVGSTSNGTVFELLFPAIFGNASDSGGGADRVD